MAVYTGAVRSITPATNDDNWFLTAGASESLRVLAVTFSGEATSSTAMHTRHARSSGQSGAATAGNVAKAHPNSPTNVCTFGTTFATTQPTLDAGDLLAESWNAHGGLMYWHAGAPDEEWVIIGAATEPVISCRNSVGTATSSYQVTWRED